MNPETIIKEKDGKRYFFRFTLNQRFQHITLASCVIILVLTGMPLKFHQAFWAPYLYKLFGGIHVAPIIHKIAGTTLLLLFVYHLSYLVVTIVKGRILPLKRNGQLTARQSDQNPAESAHDTEFQGRQRYHRSFEIFAVFIR